MTTTSTASRVVYTGDNSTVTFAIPFSFSGSSEIEVNLITTATNAVTLQTITTDYTISGANVVMVTAPTTAQKLSVTLSVEASQLTDYIANDAFGAETHEAALDKLTRLVKQLKAEIDYECVKLPTNALTSTTVTNTSIGASKIFRVNAAATGIELATVNAITGGGDSWDDEVYSNILPNLTATYNIGGASLTFANMYAANLYGTLQTNAQPNITSVGELTTLTVDNININGNTISAVSGDVVIGSSDAIDMSGNTGYLRVPQGTTAQRVGSASGEIRYNTSDAKFEYYTGSTWVQLSSGGGPGTWADPVDFSITVDTDSIYDLGTNTERFESIYGDNLYGLIGTPAQTSITSLGTLTALDVDNININGNTISASSGNVVIGASDVVDMSGNTGHMLVPTGTTAQRVGATAGETRYNTTDGKLEYYNGSSWHQLTQASTSDYVHLSTQTASSSATISFTSLMSSTYKHYEIYINHCIPATDGAYLTLEVSTDNGSTWKTGATDYYTHSGVVAGGSGGSDSQGRANIAFGLYVSSLGNDTNEISYFHVRCQGAHDTSRRTTFISNGCFESAAGSLYSDLTNGFYNANTEVTAIRFKMTSGNIANGVFSMYGIK